MEDNHSPNSLKTIKKLCVKKIKFKFILLISSPCYQLSESAPSYKNIILMLVIYKYQKVNFRDLHPNMMSYFLFFYALNVKY